MAARMMFSCHSYGMPRLRTQARQKAAVSSRNLRNTSPAEPCRVSSGPSTTATGSRSTMGVSSRIAVIE